MAYAAWMLALAGRTSRLSGAAPDVEAAGELGRVGGREPPRRLGPLAPDRGPRRCVLAITKCRGTCLAFVPRRRAEAHSRPGSTPAYTGTAF